jgi:AcrR family transcriptional regulator
LKEIKRLEDNMTQFTEAAIITSFIKLLNERPFHKITVKDIVEDCGINRNTFYYHFEDTHALVKKIFENETQKALSISMVDESWQKGFIAAAQFAMENKQAIYHIYNSVRREELESYLNCVAKDVMLKFIDKLSNRTHPNPQDIEMIADFYKYAIVGLFLEWVHEGMKADPKQLINQIGYLFEGNIVASLEKSNQNQTNQS